MNAPMDLPNQIVTVANGQAVTTSLAIAQGTENDHASVIKLVRNYLADLEEFGGVTFEMRSQAKTNSGFEIQNTQGSDFKSNPSGGGRPTEYAVLNEQQSTLLLTYMRNSDIVRRFKKALVKAFFELSKVGAGGTALNPANLSRLQLIEMAMQAEQERLALENKVEVLAPKAEALDRIATADGSLCFTDAAKTLQMRLKDLIAWLSSHKWIYQRPGTSWIGYQDKIQSGYVEHKTNTVERSDGTEKVVTQARITPKGLAKLAEAFGGGADLIAA